jgi:hypothetical protein
LPTCNGKPGDTDHDVEEYPAAASADLPRRFLEHLTFMNELLPPSPLRRERILNLASQRSSEAVPDPAPAESRAGFSVGGSLQPAPRESASGAADVLAHISPV